MKTVVAIHTAMPMVEPTKELFAKHLPDVRLIQDVIEAGEVPPAVKKRLMNYYYSYINAGADVIFNTCSFVGDIALKAKDQLDVLLVNIDDSMAENSARQSSNIGVLTTLPTTLSPTVRLIMHFVRKLEREVHITEGLAEVAFHAVIAGNKEKHDQLILDAAEKKSFRARKEG